MRLACSGTGLLRDAQCAATQAHCYVVEDTSQGVNNCDDLGFPICDMPHGPRSAIFVTEALA